jgi:hypothetical protein
VRGNRIEQGSPEKPRHGISILGHGLGAIPDPDDPQFGLWLKDDDRAQAFAIQAAFTKIGMLCHEPSASASVAYGDILIVFGPEP